MLAWLAPSSRLRRTETPERMTLVERALDSLVLTLREQGTAPPQILGVLVDDDAVEVLLARPTPPPSPSPWVAGAEGFRWRIDHSDLTTDRLLQSPPLPALACVGRVAAGTADALLNLEAAGLVGVTGDPAEAAGMVCGVATHLIGAPWARAANLVLLGFPPGLAATDNVREISSLTELAEELACHGGRDGDNGEATRLPRPRHGPIPRTGGRRLAAGRRPVGSPLSEAGSSDCSRTWPEPVPAWRRSLSTPAVTGGG